MRRGLLQAALVLGPALVLGADTGSSVSAERIPSAIVSIELAPTEARRDTSLVQTFRLDIEESAEACGTPSIRLNGAAPGGDGGDDDGRTFHVGLRTARGRPAGVGVVRYEAECISWGGQAQEQQVRFLLESVDGTPVPRASADAAVPQWTARIRQVAPARIVDIEGAAGVMLLGDYYGDGQENTAGPATASASSSFPASPSSSPSSSPSQLAAWQSSIDALGRQIAILRHDMRMRRLYMAQTFDLSRAVADVAATQQPQDLHAVLGLAWDKLAAKTKKLLLGAAGINAVDGYWPSCGGPYNETAAQGRPPPLPASWIVQQPLPREVSTEAEAAGDAELTTWPAAPYGWWDLGRSGAGADSSQEGAATSPPEDGQTDAADDGAQAVSNGRQKQQPGFFESLFHFVVFSVIFVSLVFVISRRCARRRIRRDRERLLSGENDRMGEGGYGGEGGRSDGVFNNGEEEGGQAGFQRFRTSGRPSAARFSARLRDMSQRFSERRTLRAAIREARRTRRQHQRQLRNSQPSAAKEFFIKAYRFLFRSMRHSEKLTGSNATAAADAEAVAAAARRLEAGEASMSGVPGAASASSPYPASEEVRPTVIANGHIEVPVPPTVGRGFVRNVSGTPAPAPAPVPARASTQAPPRAPAPAPAAAYMRDLSPPPRRGPRTFDYAREPLQASPYAGAASPPRSRSPSPTPEQVLASFRAAADVVGQMLAAEEGRTALTQTAEAWRRKDEREEPQESTAPAAATPRHQSQPRRPPTPSKTPYALPRTGYGDHSQSGSGSGGGNSENDRSHRRDTLFDTNSDFDDTESLPPAYSEQAYSYDEVAAASVVADGFQYQRSAQ